MAETLILPLDTDVATLALVGGKGLNLARLARAGLPVPGGFLVTTHGYRAFVRANALAPVIRDLLDATDASDPAALQHASAQIRARFVAGSVPPAGARAIRDAYATLSGAPVAVRSSATAEDLPDMSFAGQQDTFLNVVGEEALLQAVVDCWSSLWTARAIGYRARNGIAQDEVALAVVVQEMVPSEASGVLFTANPLNGRRTEMVVDATVGLGEALVAGQVEPDHYVLDAAGGILRKTVGAKAVAIHGKAGGGTVTVEQDGSARPAVPDAVIAELAALGRQVADLFGAPQDVEWAWAAGGLFLLQSRPVTSLFPLPAGMEAAPLQVFFSFGAVQGMLDPMTPLGQDVIRGFFAGAASMFGYYLSPETQRVIAVAGERLWGNMTTLVRHPIGRRLMQKALPLVEPSVAQALEALWDDPRLAPEESWFKWRTVRRVVRGFAPIFYRFLVTMRQPDAGRRRLQQFVESTLADFARRSEGATTLTRRVALLEEVVATAFPVILGWGLPIIAGGMASLNLLTQLAKRAPGEHNALEITRGLPHNVTTEMDLALWGTAQAIAADEAARALFVDREAADLAEAYRADALPEAAQRAVASFLREYGMRGVAEIDFGRPRWREDPTPVMRSLQSYLQIDDPARAPDAMFRRGAATAAEAAEELAQALQHTFLGGIKARLVRAAARRVRALAGLRESPKFFIVRLLGLARAGLLESGRELAQRGVLARPEDLFWLYSAELRALAHGERRDWQALVAERRERYARERKRRQIPRLLLSDGQAFYAGMAQGDEDEDVLVGDPVSPGVVEGLVRVVLDPAGVQLAPGEILVCPGTDPAWTPLFLPAGGLVMEVGGLMTHGSVVAREYGIPAVVGVHEATTRLATGQRVRVNGSSGRVVLLENG